MKLTFNLYTLNKKDVNINGCFSLEDNSNGRCQKQNKFKFLSINNYLILRKLISNKIFNDENNKYHLYFNILTLLILFIKIPIKVSRKSYK